MRPLLVSHAGLEARLRGARPLGSYNLDNWREFTRRTKVRSLHLADVATDLSGVRCGKIRTGPDASACPRFRSRKRQTFRTERRVLLNGSACPLWHL